MKIIYLIQKVCGLKILKISKMIMIKIKITKVLLFSVVERLQG